MWLLAKTRPSPAASPHQFSLYRTCLGLLTVLLLASSAAVEAPSETWLELPRGLRAGVRLVAAVNGLALALGVLRRVTGPLAAAMATALAGLGFIPWATAFALVVHGILVAIPPTGEPWSVWPQSGDSGPPKQWLPMAWLGVLVCSSAMALSWDPGLIGWVVCAMALALGAAIASTGPKAGLALPALLLITSVGVFAQGWATGLLCLTASGLAVISHDWLPPARSNVAHPILFFDGVCAVCDRGMQLVLAEDLSGRLRLAPLQGDTSAELLHLADIENLNSMILLDGDERVEHSDAALRVAGNLGGVWRLATALSLVPKPIRDGAYRWFVGNRYHWFGKLETCRIPTPAQRDRFLD